MVSETGSNNNRQDVEPEIKGSYTDSEDMSLRLSESADPEPDINGAKSSPADISVQEESGTFLLFDSVFNLKDPAEKDNSIEAEKFQPSAPASDQLSDELAHTKLGAFMQEFIQDVDSIKKSSSERGKNNSNIFLDNVFALAAPEFAPGLPDEDIPKEKTEPKSKLKSESESESESEPAPESFALDSESRVDTEQDNSDKFAFSDTLEKLAEKTGRVIEAVSSFIQDNKPETKVSELASPLGGSWSRSEEGEWRYRDADGKEIGSASGILGSEVDEIRNVVDNALDFTLAGGGIIRESADGTRIFFDSAESRDLGRPDRVETADGRAMKLVWRNDKLSEIHTSFSSKPGSSHYLVGENLWANSPDKTSGVKGELSIDPVSGDFTRRFLEGPAKDNSEIFRANGRFIAQNADGSSRTEIPLHDGTKLIFSGPASTSSDLADSSSFTTIDAAGKETRFTKTDKPAVFRSDSGEERLLSTREDGSFTMTKPGESGKESLTVDNAGRITVSSGQISKTWQSGNLIAHTNGEQSFAFAYAESAEPAFAEAKENIAANASIAILDDGTYSKDDSGRLSGTVSKDGTLVREFKYRQSQKQGGADEIYEARINDKTFVKIGNLARRIGPNGQEQLEMSVWKVTDSTGRQYSNWNGHIGASPNGVVTLQAFNENAPRQLGADGKALSSEEAKRRENEGIWDELPDWKPAASSNNGKKAEMSEIRQSDENRLWQKNEDGIWEHGPLDASKPYKNPPHSQASILAGQIPGSERLDFDSRLHLARTAGEYESSLPEDGNARKEFLESLRSAMASEKNFEDLGKGFSGTYEIDGKTGFLSRVHTEGKMAGEREIFRGDNFREIRHRDGKVTLDMTFPDGRRVATFARGFDEESASGSRTLSQPEKMVYTSSDGTVHEWSKSQENPDAYINGNKLYDYRFSMSEDGSYTIRDLSNQANPENIDKIRHLDGRIETRDIETGNSTIFDQNNQIIGHKADGKEIALLRSDKDGSLEELIFTSENRRWHKAADGQWQAEALDADAPYEEPVLAEISILSAEKLDFAQRLELLESARDFEKKLGQEPEDIEQRAKVAANLESRLAALSDGFKGSLAIDSQSGSFVQKASEGDRKDIAEHYRLDGIKESRHPDGKLSLEIKYADGIVREFMFKSAFGDENNEPVQPESFTVKKTDGTTHAWKNLGDGKFEVDGVEKNIEFFVTADGVYNSVDHDSGTTTTRTADGEVITDNPSRGIYHVLKDGKYSHVRSDGHELRVTYDEQGRLSEIRQEDENRIFQRDSSGAWVESAIDANEPFAPCEDFVKEFMVSDNLDALQKARMIESYREFSSNTRFSDKQKDSVLESARSLLAENSSSPFSAELRASYVDQLLWQINNPSRNEQGSNNSCNVTVLRGLALYSSPEVVAKVVALVANTGEIKTKDGTIIKPPVDSIIPREGSPEHTFPPGDGQRTALGKLWDVTAVNVFYQRRTQDELGTTRTKGSVQYMEVPSTGRGDTGNRLVRKEADGRFSYLAYNNNGNYEPYDGPRMYASRIADVYEQLTGADLKGRFLHHKDRYVGDRDQANKLINGGIDSEAALQAALDKGEFPIIVQGSTGRLKYRQMQQSALDKGEDKNSVSEPTGGEHVWLVTGYDPVTKTVSLDNSWSTAHDRMDAATASANGVDMSKYVTFSLSDLYHSMKTTANSPGKNHPLVYVYFP